MANFSKTQVLIFIIVILLLVNIAMVLSFGMKQSDKPGRNSDRGGRRPNPIAFTLKEKVGFSEQQMNQIEVLKKQHREKMHVLFEDMRKAKIAFYANVSRQEVNEDSIQALSSDLGKKQQAIEEQAFRNFREIRALCTPEQLVRYDSLMPKVIQNMWFPDRHGDSKHKDSSKARSRS